MTLEELIDAAKELADDTGSNLWSVDALTRYANEAEREAAIRSRLLLDSTTDDDGASPTPNPVCTYSVTTNQSVITLHKKIIFVRRVKLDSRDQPLQRIFLRDIDAYEPGWQGSAASEVIGYIPNWSRRVLRFHTKFPADDIVRLTVVRLPLNDMDDDEDEPEIPEEQHMGLVNWMLYRAFMKPDPDKQDKRKALDSLAEFERQFGRRESALNETWQREHGYDEYEVS